MAVNIRSMTKADVLEVKRLETECGLSPWTFEDYTNEIDRTDAVTLIAAIDSKIVGFLISRLIISNNKILFESEIEIFNICVSRKYRRLGIGKSLIDNLVKYPNNIFTTVWLEVRKSNIKARMFYSRMNFKITSTRKNLYRHPTEDGLIMKMEL